MAELYKNIETLTSPKVDIFLLGPGNIGTGFIASIYGESGESDRKYDNREIDFDVVGIMDSKGAGEMSDDFKADLRKGNRKVVRNNFTQWKKDELVPASENIRIAQIKDQYYASLYHGHSFVLVDTSNCENIYLYQDILESCPKAVIVTANKKPIVAMSHEKRKKYQKRLGYETTIMAGRGAIRKIRENLPSENITSVVLIGSGSVGGYVKALNNKEKLGDACIKFSDKFEPHPYDDLSGMDIARKLLILAKEMGYDVGLQDININSLIDKEIYEKLGQAECFHQLNIDSCRLKTAAKNLVSHDNQTLAYIGEIIPPGPTDSHPKLNISLKSIDKNSIEGITQNNTNLLKITLRHRPEPDILQGSGAGISAAVDGIRNDIKNIIFM